MNGTTIFLVVIIIAITNAFCWIWAFSSKFNKIFTILFSIGYTMFTLYCITTIY